MSMQQDTHVPGAMAKKPTVVLRHEQPAEMFEDFKDQIYTLEEEISAWEERLFRLRMCRDALSQACSMLNEALQTQPGMTMPR